MAVAVVREAQATAAAGSMSKDTVELCSETAATAAGIGITAGVAIMQLLAGPQTLMSRACLKSFSASEDVLLMLVVTVAGAACLQHERVQSVAASAAASSSVNSSTVSRDSHSKHSRSNSSSSSSLPAHLQQLIQELACSRSTCG
jgi:hypothetical protein